MSKTTADEVREAEEANAAQMLHGFLWSLEAAVANTEKDPALAAAGMEDGPLADAIAQVQDLRRRLGDVERDLTVTLGQRLGKTTGNLSDGRQFTLARSADRTAWDHESWKRDVRRKIVQGLSLESEDLVVVDANTGEEWEDRPLATVLHEVLAKAQEVHGSTAPRTTQLKALGLYATDYATSTPGAWRFQALAPTTTEETTTDV